MRYFTTTTLSLFISLVCFSQDAYLDLLFDQLKTEYSISGGSLMLQDSEESTINSAVSYGNISASIQNDNDNPFTKFHSINVLGEGTNPWDAGLNQKNANQINRNDNVLVVFWMRGSSAAIDPKVNFFVEHATNYNKEMLLTIDLTEEWSQYIIPFSSLATYNPGGLTIGLHLAYGVQKVEYAGITLINYKNKYTLQDLPNKQGSGPYAGYEDDAPWRAEAEARIQNLRRADMKLRFTDLGGTPIKNAAVSLKMKKHEFEFGTAVVSSRFAGNRNQLPIYEEKLLNIDGKGNGFNSVVFENSLKWKAWEGEWPANKSEKIKAIEWLSDEDIAIRGHNLLWPGWQWMPNDMEQNKNNPTYLVDKIKERINTILSYPGIKGVIKDWDVINEIAANRDIEDALKGKNGYTTGREIYAEAFKQVKLIDPEITTYLNDYITIGSNRDGGILYDEYKKFIHEIIDAGAEIDGIGFQAHIGGSPTAPEKVYKILDDFYQEFGTEAKITEYDTDKLVTGELGAKYMEDFLTIIFSHESVKGFLMWGFWDGNHWKENAPIFNLDWTLKPSGVAFINKVYNDWWTDENLRTDDEGYVQLNGYKGSYEIILPDFDEAFELDMSTDTSSTFKINGIVAATEVDFDQQFGIYPNPTIDLLHVISKSNQTFDYKLIDQIGRVVIDGKNSTKQQLNLANLNPGNYFIRIQMNEAIFIKKIVKI